MVVFTVRHPTPGTYQTWQRWRHETRNPTPPAVWRPCPTCWGQRILIEPDLRSASTCPQCLGIGETTT